MAMYVQGDSSSFCADQGVPATSTPVIQIGETETFEIDPSTKGEL